MALTSHLGYGPFRLADFKPGECFARFDGTMAKVADPQPPGRPDHLLVWNKHETSNAERLWLQRTALTPSRPSRPGWLRNEGKATAIAHDAYDYVPASLASQIPPLYTTEKLDDPTVWIKLFTPDFDWTWYLTEYDPAERMGFGLVIGPDQELGYFSLEEMEESRGPLGLRIERDLHFQPQPLSHIFGPSTP